MTIKSKVHEAGTSDAHTHTHIKTHVEAPFGIRTFSLPSLPIQPGASAAPFTCGIRRRPRASSSSCWRRFWTSENVDRSISSLFAPLASSSFFVFGAESSELVLLDGDGFSSVGEAGDGEEDVDEGSAGVAAAVPFAVVSELR